MSKESSVPSELGVDLEEVVWQDFALCRGWVTNDFHDNYESSVSVAKSIDEACLSCPVQVQCMQRGIENNEWGVWGGIYLVSGKPDSNRNSHKTPEVWAAIKERIGESVF